MAKPGVSIIICCYNSERRLPETLAHLFTQQVSEDIPWEIIVVNNASSDATSRIAAQAFSRAPEDLLASG